MPKWISVFGSALFIAEGLRSNRLSMKRKRRKMTIGINALSVPDVIVPASNRYEDVPCLHIHSQSSWKRG